MKVVPFCQKRDEGFFVSCETFRFLLQVIDSATNKTWPFPLSSKDKEIDTMRRWKKKELRTGLKLKAVRSDNAPELKKLLDEFEETDGVQNQSTTVARSHQNGLEERDIQTVEESIRAMISPLAHT